MTSRQEVPTAATLKDSFLPASDWWYGIDGRAWERNFCSIHRSHTICDLIPIYWISINVKHRSHSIKRLIPHQFFILQSRQIWRELVDKYWGFSHDFLEPETPSFSDSNGVRTVSFRIMSLWPSLAYELLFKMSMHQCCCFCWPTINNIVNNLHQFTKLTTNQWISIIDDYHCFN